jgi:hypothetical protein
MRLAAGEHAEGSSISVISWAVLSSAIFVSRKSSTRTYPLIDDSRMLYLSHRKSEGLQ